MIKNIIFDFGDIFINLDKQATFRNMAAFGYSEYTKELDTLCKNYETGLVTSKDFVLGLKKLYPEAKEKQLIDAWNSILLDFPEYRLEFIEKFRLDGTHRLFLLSNTNELHIACVEEIMGKNRFNRFRNCFEAFYLSHEIKMRKPNYDIYEYIIKQNSLQPEETLFIDDTKENTESAEALGIKCWNLQVGKEDVIELTPKLK